MNTTPRAILPPAMLGILGGGQLGRMFTVAAQTMGYRVTVLDPDPHAPAAAFAERHLCAPFDDAAALAELAQCAAVTTEFENVSADAMRFLAKHTTVSPSGDCVAIAQNRIEEKAWIRKAGLQTAPYQVVQSAADISEASPEFLPGILKTATLGYDGKGQIRVHSLAQLHEAFAAHGKVACVLEKMVDLRSEISVIVCRLSNAESRTFDPAENIHENGILAYSIVPARLPQAHGHEILRADIGVDGAVLCIEHHDAGRQRVEQLGGLEMRERRMVVAKRAHDGHAPQPAGCRGLRVSWRAACVRAPVSRAGARGN